jgi:hypothetical protein
MPPGLRTVTLAVPWPAIKLADTEAVNCVPLTYVVGSADPFHCTIDPATNPEPFTAIVNIGPEAVEEPGFKPLMDGLLPRTVNAVRNPNAATAELDMFRTFPALSTSSTVGVQVPPWLNCGMFTLTVPDTLSCPPKVTVFPYHTVWEGLYHVTATASTPERSSVTLKVD